MIISWTHPTTGATIPLHDFGALTNVIPPGVLNAILLKERADERHKGQQVTVTAGLGCPRKWAIHHMLQTPVNPAKVWAAQRGTWLHEQMGHAMVGVDDWVTEESEPEACVFQGRLFNIDMSCKVDARRDDFSAIWDYKFRAPFSAKFADPTGAAKLEDAAQLNMCRLLMEQTTGRDLREMEMRVWVDAGGWMPTFAPIMSEYEIGQVKPGGGSYTVAQIFEWLATIVRMWAHLGAQATQDDLKVLVRTVPKVGESMFKNKSGGNMCTSYCEVMETCFGLEGGV